MSPLRANPASCWTRRASNVSWQRDFQVSDPWASTHFLSKSEFDLKDISNSHRNLYIWWRNKFSGYCLWYLFNPKLPRKESRWTSKLCHRNRHILAWVDSGETPKIKFKTCQSKSSSHRHLAMLAFLGNAIDNFKELTCAASFANSWSEVSPRSWTRYERLI